MLVLQRPVLTLFLTFCLVAGLSYFAPQFKLDASAESLVLEGDKDMLYYRAIRARYAAEDYLIITYAPHGDLFSDETLTKIRQLQDDLEQMPRVSSVTSLLNVPLINSPPISLAELQQEIPLITSARTDRALAAKEFTSSPLYRELIASKDGKTTAMQVFFKRDPAYQDLMQRRNALREMALQKPLTLQEHLQHEILNREFRRINDTQMEREQADLKQIREILDRYRDAATIHLGGVYLVTSDMIDYVAHDLKVFGVGVLCFLVLLLLLFFGRPRWVLMPMLICSAAALGVVGFLGMVEWRVTVVSSNFISLMLIITLSLAVHLVVRYRELHRLSPQTGQLDLVWETVRSKAMPAFYTAITTMVAFGSLIVSGIRPVIDFGWMMVFGVGLAFLLTFLIFPSVLSLFSPAPIKDRSDFTNKITAAVARMIEANSKSVFFVFLLILVFGVVGITNLRVDNRFIDYFKSSTEIHQGILTIDQELGGSAPLDIILDPDKAYFEELEYMKAEGLLDESIGISGFSYWFNMFQLGKVEKIHDYLESLPETGKVLSIATSMKLLRQINNGKELDNVSLAVMHKRLPEAIKEDLFRPYMTDDGNQLRFDIRLFDSDKNLQRDVLLKKIRHELKTKFDLADEQIKLNGMTVLYNNLLQSLFQSQILTLGVVLLAIMLMFMVLFRSVSVAVLAIVPNVVAAGAILGLMGWLKIPLDIMTITIAAITIGIGVDNSIHYVHRFREEFARRGQYWAAVRYSHASIGKAMYYTTVTITLGFSILVLSSFVPTIYFGLLTGMAMLVAWLANFMLLPLLLVKFKPLGQESAHAQE